MPCDSSHCEPTTREVESRKVLEFLREMRDQSFNHENPKTPYYGSVETLDWNTASLCAMCKDKGVSERSLELQLWWRDHQAADAKKAKKASYVFP